MGKKKCPLNKMYKDIIPWMNSIWTDFRFVEFSKAKILKPIIENAWILSATICDPSCRNCYKKQCAFWDFVRDKKRALGFTDAAYFKLTDLTAEWHKKRHEYQKMKQPSEKVLWRRKRKEELARMEKEIEFAKTHTYEYCNKPYLEKLKDAGDTMFGEIQNFKY